jgi:hypothetical protein
MKRLNFLLFSAFCSLLAVAQEGGGGADINVDINKDGGGGAGFFGNPVVWVVGAAVFILLLVALLRGRGRD